MILLSHPTVDTTVRHVARALDRAGVLGEFWTCSLEGNAPSSLLVAPGTLEADPAAPGLTEAGGTGYTAGLDVWPGPLRPRRQTLDTMRRFLDRTVSARLACDHFKGIYAHEDSAEESFRIAGLRGQLRVYDLAGGNWQAERETYAEEAALEPEWAATLHLPELAPREIERRNSELRQADLVVVPSSFLLRTFETASALPETLALIVPGAPAHLGPDAAPPGRPDGRLRALFVGELGQRKGLSYLFAACRELRRAVSLTVIGAPPPAPCPALERELREVRWLPACTAADIRAEMAAHDVLIAPSIFDGFDPVIIRALAAGLPVIATPHTIAPDLIDHGVEGFIVPIRAPDEIAAKLDLLRREPERRAEMSLQARCCAHRHTWENYERSVAACVATALSRR